MKVLLSPAKALDYSNPLDTPFHSFPNFLDDTNSLVKKLQKFSVADLKSMMNVSDAIAELNYSRYKNWKTPEKIGPEVLPAISVFDGAAFKGFDAHSLSKDELETAQETVRILSGLYGILKPLDLMYPYRLEMGTKWMVDKNTPNLYKYWGSRLSEFLNKELGKGEFVVNLASTEYFKAIDQKVLQAKIITPIFKEEKEGKYKVVMMYAKTARGKMARDIVQNQYQNVEDLKGYDVDGYAFREEMSNDKEWVFVR